MLGVRILFLCTLTPLSLQLVACDPPPAVLAGTGGTSNVSSTSSGGSDAGGQSTRLTGGITLVTPEQVDALEQASCAGMVMAVSDAPVVTSFIIDSSASMGETAANTQGRTKWQVTRDAVVNAVSRFDTESAVGLLVFPNEVTLANPSYDTVPLSNCLNTAPALAPEVLANADAGTVPLTLISSALDAVTPEGARPTCDAFDYAWSSFMSPGRFQPNEALRQHAILITDGSPTLSRGCRGAGQEQAPVDPAEVIDNVRSIWSNSFVQTSVIGLPGSERASRNSSEGRVWLSQAAQAGAMRSTLNCDDTGNPAFCHYDLTQSNDLQTSIEQAIAAIFDANVTCVYPAPYPMTGVPTFTTVIVSTTDGSTTTAQAVGQAEPNCPQDDGWFFANSADQTSVYLCPKTCAALKSHPNATVTVAVNCRLNELLG